MSTHPAVQDVDEDHQPSWWRRDHPTFSALTGFFTGLFFVAVVPAGYVAALSAALGRERAEELFPFVLLTLAIPLGLVAYPSTRRFGGYMWLGILLTTVVVFGVGALVVWFLIGFGG